MNSYIEVTWIILWGISLCSHVLASALIARHITWKKVMLISAGCCLVSVVGYDCWYWVFLAEIAQCLLIYRFSIKAMLQMELARFFYLTLGQLWTKGLMINTILFVDASRTSWLSYCLFLFAMGYLTQKWIVPKMIRQRYEMDVTLKIKDSKFQCRGYLDSGNSLKYRNCPVLFLSYRFSEFVQEVTGETIRFHTISQENECLVYPCEIYIDKVWRNAYVAFSRNVVKPVDCLLNSRLFC